MFKLIFGLSFFVSVAMAQHHHGGEQPPIHGMLMMGSDKIYLSHLPMFHAPHDYQAILEVTLDPGSKQTYLETVKSHPEEKVFTLEPEAFVLPDLVKKPRAFKGKIYLGHFERGGSVIIANVTVKISKIIYFKKFDPTAVRPSQLTYLLFGSKSGLFLAHKIEVRPDFDQIVELKPEADLLNRINQSPLVEVTDLDPNLGRELYLEYGDLE